MCSTGIQVTTYWRVLAWSLVALVRGVNADAPERDPEATSRLLTPVTLSADVERLATPKDLIQRCAVEVLEAYLPEHKRRPSQDSIRFGCFHNQDPDAVRNGVFQSPCPCVWLPTWIDRTTSPGKPLPFDLSCAGLPMAK